MVFGGICHAGKGAVLMKFKKIVPVLLSMTFCLSSATYPALPAGAAAHHGSGTAGVNVTVTVEDADDDSTGGQMPDDDGTGDKIPGGGTGGQTPGSSGGDDTEPGQDDGGSKADTGKDDTNDGGNAGKDKDKDKNKDKDKDKGSGGTQNGEGDKGADDGNDDSSKGTGGKPGKKNPSGRPAILPVSGYPVGRVPDAYPEPGRGLDGGAGDSVGDGGALDGASGSIKEQVDTAESGNADETDESGGDGDESDRDGDESDGAGGSGSKSNGFIKMALRYWKQAALAVLALAVSVLAVFFTRRKIRFHGILADKDIDGVLFRRDTDSANGGAVIPELIGKLNENGISFEEYENMVMGSRDMTLLPTGTKMDISVTDDGLAKTWTAEKADERRMYDRLGEAALLAQMKGQIIQADVILKHDRKGIEIPLHFIFR